MAASDGRPGVTRGTQTGKVSGWCVGVGLGAGAREGSVTAGLSGRVMWAGTAPRGGGGGGGGVGGEASVEIDAERAERGAD